MGVIPSTGINWGFAGEDVFNNTDKIVTSLSTFILVAAAIYLAPKIIDLLKFVFGDRSALDDFYNQGFTESWVSKLSGGMYSIDEDELEDWDDADE